LLGEFSRLARIGISASVGLIAYLIVAVGVFRVTRPLRLAFSLLLELGAIPLRVGRGA
jgi:PST family polysaccharide transporter